MKDFIYKKEDNMGGIIRFEFIPVDDIESIDIAVDHRIITPVVLKPGKEWFCGYSTFAMLSYSEPEEQSSAGTIFKRSFPGFFPKDDADADLLFSKMKHRRFVVKYTDSNSLMKLIGSIEEPLRFTSSLNTKDQPSGLAGHSFTFYGDGTHKAFVYDI